MKIEILPEKKLYCITQKIHESKDNVYFLSILDAPPSFYKSYELTHLFLFFLIYSYLFK